MNAQTIRRKKRFRKIFMSLKKIFNLCLPTFVLSIVLSSCFYQGESGNMGREVSEESAQGDASSTPYVEPVASFKVGVDDNYDFGEVFVGAYAEGTATVKFSGNTATTLSSTPTLTAPFSFKGGSYPGTGGTCSQNFNTDCTLVLRFTPTTSGVQTSSLKLSYNYGSGNSSKGYYVLKLKGNGINASISIVQENGIYVDSERLLTRLDRFKVSCAANVSGITLTVASATTSSYYSCTGQIATIPIDGLNGKQIKLQASYFQTNNLDRSAIGNSLIYTVTYDTTAPTVTPNKLGGYYLANPESVSLSLSESGTTYYCLAKGSCCSPTATTTYTYATAFNVKTSQSTGTEQGSFCLTYYGVDLVGNTGSVGTQTYVVRDTSGPDLSTNYSQTYLQSRESVSINVNSNQFGESGYYVEFRSVPLSTYATYSSSSCKTLLTAARSAGGNVYLNQDQWGSSITSSAISLSTSSQGVTAELNSNSLSYGQNVLLIAVYNPDYDSQSDGAKYTCQVASVYLQDFGMNDNESDDETYSVCSSSSSFDSGEETESSENGNFEAEFSEYGYFEDGNENYGSGRSSNSNQSLAHSYLNIIQ